MRRTLAPQQPLLLLSVCSLLVWLTAAVAEEDGLGFLEASHVLQLGSLSFDATLARFDAALVEFVRPSCDLCNATATLQFRLAAALHRPAHGKLLFAFVDAETHESLAAKFKIEAFPTTALFLAGSPVIYRGPRDPERLLSWAEERRSFEPPSVDALGFAELKQQQKAALVFVGTAGRELDCFKRFARCTPSLETFHLDGSLAAGALQAETGLSGRSWSVVLVGAQRETAHVFEESAISQAGLRAFVERHRHPLVASFSSPESLERVFFEEGSSIVYLSSGNKDRFLKTFASLARTNRDSLKFFVSRPRDLHSLELTEFLGLPSSPPRQLWLIHNHPGGIDSYKFDSKLTPGGLRAFLKRFFSGQLVPGFSNAADSSIVWDMADPEVFVQLRNSNSTVVVFNYQKLLCRKRLACKNKLRVFRRFASRLHNVPGLEFGTLDLGRGYRITKGAFYRYFRTAMPAISVSLPHASEPLALPYFDWSFETLQKWVRRNVSGGRPQASASGLQQNSPSG